MTELKPHSRLLPSALRRSRFLSPLRIAVLTILSQSIPIWNDRFRSITRPKLLISFFLATSAFYCFVIGRDRYTAVSEFVIQQAAPFNASASPAFTGAPAVASPQVLASFCSSLRQLVPSSFEIRMTIACRIFVVS